MNDPLDLIREARDSYDLVTGIVGLFSGGNDSTVMLHACNPLLTHAAHINTGIGIPETRSFVRSTAEAFGLPLIEVSPPEGHTYVDLVMEHGFPGPAGHLFAYSRLKERALREVRRKFIRNGRAQRVLYVTGIRRAESQRRMPINDYIKREGSVVWVSPLLDWTSDDMNAYREAHPDVPRNPVNDHLHMSGECLCGAFAKPGELDEIAFFYPDVAREIRELECRVRDAGIAACKWGQRPPGKVKAATPGPLCTSCVGAEASDDGTSTGAQS